MISILSIYQYCINIVRIMLLMYNICDTDMIYKMNFRNFRTHGTYFEK